MLRRTILLLFLGTAMSPLHAEDGNVETRPGNWPHFRGPTHDLISTATHLLDAWPDAGPALVWTFKQAGSGYSSVSVADGRIYTQGHFGEEERVLALDEKTGALIWSVVAGPAEVVELPGCRSIPTVDGDRIYVATVGGDIVCLEAAAGREIWRRHLAHDFGGRRGAYGYSASPLVAGDRLICMAGSKDGTIIALDKQLGEPAWKGVSPTADTASYVTPLAIRVGTMPLIVAITVGGVMGFHGDDGSFLWSESRSANGNANCTTPVYRDGLLFSSSAYGAGAALIRLSAEPGGVSSELVYHTNHMKNHHGGFVLVDGHIYGANDSVWACLELQSGNVVWRDRSVGKGSVMVADGHLYLRGESGEMALVKATPEGYRESGRFMPPHRSDKNAWAYPVVTGGRLFLRDQNVLLSYDVGDP